MIKLAYSCKIILIDFGIRINVTENEGICMKVRINLF